MSKLALAVAVGLLAAGFALAAPASHVIRGDTQIGLFRVQADGTLSGVIRAFGAPDTRRRSGVSCRAVWRAHGLTVNFYNLGGHNPCTPSGGRFSQAIMRGGHWRTSRGLGVGMPASAIRRLHPRAVFRPGRRHAWPSGWWLVTRTSPFGNGGEYPGLLAETRNGRVFGFRVRFPAGGD